MLSDNFDKRTNGKTRLQISLRELLLIMVVVAMGAAWALTRSQLQKSDSELAKLRAEVGFLEPSTADQVAAVRLPSNQPLTYRLRIRTPDHPRYRVAYSSVWEKDSSGPTWFAAAPLPQGESVVIVRVMKDPRDERWKITTLVQSDAGTKRIGTVLPDEHAAIFRQTAEVISAGVGRQTLAIDKAKPLRLLDEKWLVGEGGLMLYGDRPPERDQVGIYAELQPDIGTL
ncbi:hypothetical protein [Planctomycetes bacterium K23_9]|uniref:Uncharacterized protein n=1 Tax=Stieleria marina TaxID=1930275 RepID=A0A517NZ64_9BACT|nr:hypothetical protein K239x_44210 [Planctomycetes bacterium K23_9]